MTERASLNSPVQRAAAAKSSRSLAPSSFSASACLSNPYASRQSLRSIAARPAASASSTTCDMGGLWHKGARGIGRALPGHSPSRPSAPVDRDHVHELRDALKLRGAGLGNAVAHGSVRERLGARHDLPGARERADPGRGMDTVAAEVDLVLRERLASVEADPNVGRDPVVLRERALDRDGRLDRSPGTIEGGEEAVSRLLDHLAAMCLKKLAERPVVPGQEILPLRRS